LPDELEQYKSCEADVPVDEKLAKSKQKRFIVLAFHIILVINMCKKSHLSFEEETFC